MNVYLHKKRLLQEKSRKFVQAKKKKDAMAYEFNTDSFSLVVNIWDQ